MIQSAYSSTLTAASSRYLRTDCDVSDFYYEVVQISVSRSGCYAFDRNSSMNTSSYIYEGDFDSTDWLRNLVSQNNDHSSIVFLKQTIYLRISTTYMMVVATHSSTVPGPFLVTTFGPGDINFERMSE